MRITINLDADLVLTIRRYAESRSLSLGQTVSELIRRGIRANVPSRIINGLHVVDLPSDSPRVSARRVREVAQDE